MAEQSKEALQKWKLSNECMHLTVHGGYVDCADVKEEAFLAGFHAASNERKEILVCTGGDWADAGFDVWNLPSDVDVEKAREAWQKNRSTISFTAWIEKHHDAREGGDIEEVWLN